jgi:hypothetical protein
MYVFYADRKSKMATTAIHHFEFHTGIKNVQFVEDHPMNIPVQFGFIHICSYATFSNISAISWRPVLVVEVAGVPGENHRP